VTTTGVSGRTFRAPSAGTTLTVAAADDAPPPPLDPPAAPAEEPCDVPVIEAVPEHPASPSAVPSARAHQPRARTLNSFTNRVDRRRTVDALGPLDTRTVKPRGCHLHDIRSAG
jgi:hypothetical protein